MLGEGDQLQVTNIAYFFAHLDQSPQGSQCRVTYIHVATNIECTLCYLPADLFECSMLDIFARQTRLPLAPNLDAFQQCSSRVVARLSNGEHGIEMNMCITERRRDKPASSINLACGSVAIHLTRNSSQPSIFHIDTTKRP